MILYHVPHPLEAGIKDSRVTKDVSKFLKEAGPYSFSSVADVLGRTACDVGVTVFVSFSVMMGRERFRSGEEPKSGVFSVVMGGTVRRVEQSKFTYFK